MRLSLLSAGLLLAAGTAQAQVYLSAGPTLGGSTSTIDGNLPGTNYGMTSASSTRQLAPQAGLTFSARLGHFALQPSVLYTRKGMTNTYDSEGIYQSQRYHAHTKSGFKASYLEVPLNLVGTLGRNGRGLQVLAGPYVALALRGTQHYEQYYDEKITPAPGSEVSFERHAYDTDLRIGKPNEPVYYQPVLRRFDWGANLGAGYAAGPWQLQAIYSLSLGKNTESHAQIRPPYTYAYTPYRVWQLRLSYLLGGQRERKLPGFLQFLNLKSAQ